VINARSIERLSGVSTLIFRKRCMRSFIPGNLAAMSGVLKLPAAPAGRSGVFVNILVDVMIKILNRLKFINNEMSSGGSGEASSHVL
jgi:hypothetical protein